MLQPTNSNFRIKSQHQTRDTETQTPNVNMSNVLHLWDNPLSANPIKWSNTLEEFVGNLPTNYLSVFDHFVILALKGLKLVQP